MAVAARCVLVRLLYDRVTGLVAAGLLLTAVTFWFYGEVAYPYTCTGYFGHPRGSQRCRVARVGRRAQ